MARVLYRAMLSKIAIARVALVLTALMLPSAALAQSPFQLELNGLWFLPAGTLETGGSVNTSDRFGSGPGFGAAVSLRTIAELSDVLDVVEVRVETPLEALLRWKVGIGLRHLPHVLGRRAHHLDVEAPLAREVEHRVRLRVDQERGVFAVTTKRSGAKRPTGSLSVPGTSPVPM